MKIKYLLPVLIILAVQSVFAQNHLVTHNFIRQKVTEGYFTQKSGTTIPQDNFCISKSEAMSWLVLDESYLPSDNRMPWWSELVPPAFVERSIIVQNLTNGSCITVVDGLPGYTLPYSLCDPSGGMSYDAGTFIGNPPYLEIHIQDVYSQWQVIDLIVGGTSVTFVPNTYGTPYQSILIDPSYITNVPGDVIIYVY